MCSIELILFENQEMTELANALCVAFDARCDPSIGRGGTDAEGSVAEAAQRWVHAIHAAFYASTPRGRVSASSGTKFLELETTLTQLFTKLSQQQQDSGDDEEDGFWTFVVRVVLLLCQEPKPPSALGADVDRAGADAQTDTNDTSSAVAADLLLPDASTVRNGATAKRTKKKKENAQPNMPLAFIVVNALKKLTKSGDDPTKRRCRYQGKTNAALIAFCTQGLDDPKAMVWFLYRRFARTYLDWGRLTLCCMSVWCRIRNCSLKCSTFSV